MKAAPLFVFAIALTGLLGSGSATFFNKPAPAPAPAPARVQCPPQPIYYMYGPEEPTNNNPKPQPDPTKCKYPVCPDDSTRVCGAITEGTEQKCRYFKCDNRIKNYNCQNDADVQKVALNYCKGLRLGTNFKTCNVDAVES